MAKKLAIILLILILSAVATVTAVTLLNKDDGGSGAGTEQGESSGGSQTGGGQSGGSQSGSGSQGSNGNQGGSQGSDGSSGGNQSSGSQGGNSQGSGGGQSGSGTTTHTHEYTLFVEKVPASCTSMGYDLYQCKSDGCTETKKENFVNPLNHNFGEWTTTKKATCTEDGIKTRVCANDADHSETEAIPSLGGHSFTIFNTVKKATCTEEGEEVATCDRCTETKSQAIPRTAHKYGTPVSDVKATCTTTGKKTSTCSECGNKKTETEPATGHKYVNGICEYCHDELPVKETEGLEYEEYESGYRVKGIGTVTSLKDSSASVDLIIPATHEGKPVLEIGSSAFSGCSGIASVTIPENVTRIDSGAFAGCGNLSEVVFPNSLQYIGASAFEACYKITSLNIPKNVSSIGNGAFRLGIGSMDGSMLESITVASDNPYLSSAGNCIIYIHNRQLYLGCKNSIIPADGSVTSISSEAFYNSGITSINIPYGVSHIGSYSFAGCSELKTVTLSNSVTNIDNNAFAGCNNISDVYYIGTAAEWNSINIGSDNEKLVNASRTYSASGFEFAEIKEGGTVVAYSLVGKGSAVFTDTLLIPSVYNGKPVTKIDTGVGLFGKLYDTTVKTLIIPYGITSIGDSSFLNFRELTTVIIADSVTSIGDTAFENCLKLTNISMGESVQSIGYMAFAQCNNLTTITIPKSVTVIGDYAFQQTAITTVNYGGTQSEWNAIQFGEGKGWLTNANITYNI